MEEHPGLLVERVSPFLRCGSLPPAVALAACAPAAAASHRGWETRSLPGGAYYQQLLLLSPARISLPQPTASPWARSPPTPPFPSPPPPPKAPQRPGLFFAVAQPRAQVLSSRMGHWGREHEE